MRPSSAARFPFSSISRFSCASRLAKSSTHPGEARQRILLLGLFRHQIDVLDLLFFLLLPAGPLHLAELLDGLGAFGDGPPTFADELFRLRCSLSEGRDLVSRFPFPPFESLALGEVLLLSFGEIRDLPPGEFYSLFLDIDGVFCFVEFFLAAGDEIFVFQNHRLEFFQGGFEPLQLGPDFHLSVLEGIFSLLPVRPGGRSGRHRPEARRSTRPPSPLV